MQAIAAAKAQETYKKMCDDARKVDYHVAVMIEYESELPRITPVMAFWWWDNMGPIERYRLWSPEHVDFQWELDTAAHGRIGAIHSVTEYVGGDPRISSLTIRRPGSFSRLSKIQTCDRERFFDVRQPYYGMDPSRV